MTTVTELEYRQDSAHWFGHLAHSPHSVFLDSGQGGPFAGRYDILAADPCVTLTTRGRETEIRSAEGVRRSTDDPLSVLRQLLGDRVSEHQNLPFIGGAIGCFSYDLGRRFERMPVVAERDIDFPEMTVGIYDWAFVVDHRERRRFLVGGGRDPATRERWPELEQLGAREGPARPERFEVVTPVRSNFSPPGYAHAFARVQEHIRLGDCYQVNLAQRFQADVRGDSWAAYRILRELSPAPFSAYLSTPDGDVLCSSPERFLRVEGDRVESRPIKGTRARSADRQRDQELRDALAGSLKDRAENVMIVDLLRNDLGKVCVPGSVAATGLFEIESFAHVHHMVSTVSGRLAASHDALDLVRACFPGGSITGAPKLRAMEIIDALEQQRRSVYCGSLGYLSYGGRMDTNIAIRTLLRTGNSIYAWAGGGIVADSVCEAEYQESLDKASALLAVLADSTVTATA